MKRPILAVVLLLTAGILAGFAVAWPLTVVALCAAVVFFAYLLRRKMMYLAAFTFFIGVLAAGGRVHRDVLAWEGRTVEIRGDVFDVATTKTGRLFYLETETVNGTKARERLAVRMAGEEDIAIGDSLHLYGRIERPAAAKNPNFFDYDLYLRSRGIYALLRVSEWALLEKGRTESRSLTWRGNFHTFVETTFDRILSERNAGVMKTVFLGMDRMAEEDGDVYRELGLSHLLAASGLHVTLLAGFITWILRRLRIHAKIAQLLALTVVLVYAWAIQWPPSVLRATGMFAVQTLAFLFARRYDDKSALWVSVALILLINPYNLFRAGFQLSVAACLGIYYLYPKLIRFFPHFRQTGKNIIFLLSIQATLLPFQLYHFNEISLLVIPANLLVVPLFSLCILLGAAALAASLLAPVLAFVGFALNALLTVHGLLVKGLAMMAAPIVTAASPSPLDMLFYYGFLLGFSSTPRYRIRRILRSLSAKGFTFFLAIHLLMILWTKPLIVDFIDIGQGDAILLRSGTYAAMIDVGGGMNNSGTYTLLPYLKKTGITRLNAVFLSHEDSDHAGNLEILLQNVPVDAVVVNAAYSGLPGELRRTAIPGETYAVGDGELVVLPAAKAPNTTNDNSMALRMEHFDTSIAFPGDLEGRAEEQVALEGGPIDILKVAHHGSGSSSSDVALDAWSPAVAVLSVGERNYYGHPAPEVVRRLTNRNIPVYRTDRDGAVRFVVDRFGYSVAKTVVRQKSFRAFFDQNTFHLVHVLGYTLLWWRLAREERKKGEEHGLHRIH